MKGSDAKERETELVVATHNKHKIAELRRLLEDTIPSLSLRGYDGVAPVEHGTTFAENALIKARAAAKFTGMLALADDSGICVQVMGGAPGIFSARWTPGREAADNNELLLWHLSDVSDKDRGAHFACAVALAHPDGTEVVTEGTWFGRILREPRGEQFGYDPIFAPEGHSGSAAELPLAVKNAESHRGIAFRAMVPHIQRLLGNPGL